MVKVTKERFEGEVLGAETPVLADFHADWCGPCRALRPVLEELEAAEAGVKFVSVNVDEERELAGEYGIASIPCPAMAFIPHLLTTQKDSRCFNRSLTDGRAVRPGKGDLFRIIS